MNRATVFISGATGIAAATAEKLSRSGINVFIASLDENDCLTLTTSLTESGGTTSYFSGDLSQPAEGESAVQACLTRFGRIDGVFNAAGISGRRFGDGPMHECTPEGLQAVLSNNLGTVFSICRPALRAMMNQAPDDRGRRGAIVNLSSVLSRHPESRHFATHAYAASKGAIEAVTISMASYYSSFGIRINAIAPGLVRTPMSRRAQDSSEIQNFIATKQRLTGGMLLPEEIAGLAAFLLSDDSTGITGCVIDADGGWSVN